MKTIIYLLTLLTLPLFAERVDIISQGSSFSPKDLPINLKSIKDAGFRILWLNLGNFDFYIENYYSPDVKKVIVMDSYPSKEQISKLPKEKLVLFVWEPTGVHEKGLYTDLFSRVYSWNDDLVDNKLVFKFQYPCLKLMRDNCPSFEEKKLCTMVAGRLIPERKKIIDFFSSKPEGDFEFYGSSTQNPYFDRMYRGKIKGSTSGDEKIEVIKDYRFCVCIENTSKLKGYISEKIFSAFAAGCIPIYCGPPNISDYIPKDCFIDCTTFDSFEEVYQYIKNMPKDIYNQYIDNIKNFIENEKGYQFSNQHFNEILLDAISS